MLIHTQTCPSIGQLSTTQTICRELPSTLSINGFSNLSLLENGEADFDVAFVLLPPGGATDVYEGTYYTIGTVSPDYSSSSAELYLAAYSLPLGDYSVAAILSPAPIDTDCRPLTLLNVSVSDCDYIGNFTFFDFNVDGTFNGNDIPLPGVEVNLFNTTGQPAAEETQWSDATGQFWLAAIPTGDYFLTFSTTRGMRAAPYIGGNNHNNAQVDLKWGFQNTRFFICRRCPIYLAMLGLLARCYCR
ncbi:MAG: SdrD B-like domain-containing protein [Saprospiraceae bacterium]